MSDPRSSAPAGAIHMAEQIDGSALDPRRGPGRRTCDKKDTWPSRKGTFTVHPTNAPDQHRIGPFLYRCPDVHSGTGALYGQGSLPSGRPSEPLPI